MFSDGQQINDWFLAQTGMDFIDWFNSVHAGKGQWAGLKIAGAPLAVLKQRFLEFWNRIPLMFDPNQQCDLIQFVCLMSIAINEASGNFTGIGEGGTLKYLYEPKYRMVKGVRKKIGLPYNAAPNKTAGDLFKLQTFIDAHGIKALGFELGGQDLSEWKAVEPYPQGAPTTPDAAAAGFIMETDFYKFRGRGAIQTTWRSNYVGLISRIQTYTGPNTLIASYAQLWADQATDLVATQSSFVQWDELFSDADLRGLAVSNHSRNSGDYLIMDIDAAGLNGVAKGSIFYIGYRVSGGESYGVLFRKRVIQILNSLGNNPSGEVIEI